ncbi:hypothetical protein LZC95_13290 [Pendulispora brunnea]|uniref:Uncharacterized protein n=1 Tax=Pendulispora brunnea TaxID=2905690 RepID=A0ABZ2KIE5_9BACT
MMRARSALALAAFAWVCTSCFVDPADDSEYYGRKTGSVTLRWTINGAADPSRCQLSASPRIFITILAGPSPVDYRQDCAAFATSIELPPGTYSGDVHLEDAAGQPRTTDIRVVPFEIIEGSNLDIPIDFPADSFF